MSEVRRFDPTDRRQRKVPGLVPQVIDESNPTAVLNRNLRVAYFKQTTAKTTMFAGATRDLLDLMPLESQNKFLVSHIKKE